MDLSELNLNDEQTEKINKIISDFEKKIEDLNSEIKKLEPEEKTPEEKALEDRIKALEDREKEIADKERLAQVKEKLTEKGISANLADLFNIGEDMDADIDRIAKELNSFNHEHSFKPTTHGKSSEITKEQFSKMNYSERMNLYNTQPELYAALNR